jgi:hypothetical protein
MILYAHHLPCGMVLSLEGRVVITSPTGMSATIPAAERQYFVSHDEAERMVDWALRTPWHERLRAACYRLVGANFGAIYKRQG